MAPEHVEGVGPDLIGWDVEDANHEGPGDGVLGRLDPLTLALGSKPCGAGRARLRWSRCGLMAGAGPLSQTRGPA